MATTDKIIDYCLKGIGEDTASPVEMTRVEVLEIINQLYQNDIGKRLKNLVSFSYDGSDAAHTITAGIGTLPTDFLLPSRVYDGDAPDDEPLIQIFTINEKVSATDVTMQYMLPDNENIWIFGTTPTSTIKMYYYKQPTALTDSASSSPTSLKSEFHIEPFVWKVKEVYATRNNDTYDALDAKAMVLDYLDQIGFAHSAEKQDDSTFVIEDVYGGLE